MKGATLRAIVEQLGTIVRPDPHNRRGHYVRFRDGRPLGFYDTHDDGAYRHGWVELPGSRGRTDCNSLPEFLALLTRRTTP